MRRIFSFRKNQTFPCRAVPQLRRLLIKCIFSADLRSHANLFVVLYIVVGSGRFRYISFSQAPVYLLLSFFRWVSKLARNKCKASRAQFTHGNDAQPLGNVRSAAGPESGVVQLLLNKARWRRTTRVHIRIRNASATTVMFLFLMSTITA